MEVVESILNILFRKKEYSNLQYGNTKKEEFEIVLSKISGDKVFIQNNWQPYNEEETRKFPKVRRLCICTQSIVNLCFIQHIKSGIVLCVGNHCINKIEEANGYEPKLAKLYEYNNKLLEKCGNTTVDSGIHQGKLYKNTPDSWLKWMLENYPWKFNNKMKEYIKYRTTRLKLQ